MSYSYHCVFFFFSHSEFSSGSENCGACDHDIAPVSPRREKNIQWAYAFKEFFLRKKLSDFPSGTAVKNSPPSAGDMDWIPGLEDPTGPEATKPVSHNYWARALQPVSHKRSHHSEKLPYHNKEQYPLLQLDKVQAQQYDPEQPKY